MIVRTPNRWQSAREGARAERCTVASTKSCPQAERADGREHSMPTDATERVAAPNGEHSALRRLMASRACRGTRTQDGTVIRGKKDELCERCRRHQARIILELRVRYVADS